MATDPSRYLEVVSNQPKEVSMPTSTAVRPVSKFSIVALKVKPDRESALWYCLRDINHRESGRPDLEDAADTLLYLFGYSVSIACGVLGGGDVLFLTK